MRTSYLRQQAGYDVVALDVSAGAIEMCRRRGVRQTVTGTVADLPAANVLPFDTLLLLGNNLGLLRDEQHAPVMLAVPATCFIQLEEQPQERLFSHDYANHYIELCARMMHVAGTTGSALGA